MLLMVPHRNSPDQRTGMQCSSGWQQCFSVTNGNPRSKAHTAPEGWQSLSERTVGAARTATGRRTRTTAARMRAMAR
jgi:hypothetical protein